MDIKNGLKRIHGQKGYMVVGCLWVWGHTRLINPALGRVESPSLFSTWAKKEGLSSAGYDADPECRVAGEDLNGGEVRNQILSVRSNQRKRRATAAQ